RRRRARGGREPRSEGDWRGSPGPRRGTPAAAGLRAQCRRSSPSCRKARAAARATLSGGRRLCPPYLARVRISSACPRNTDRAGGGAVPFAPRFLALPAPPLPRTGLRAPRGRKPPASADPRASRKRTDTLLRAAQGDSRIDACCLRLALGWRG